MPLSGRDRFVSSLSCADAPRQQFVDPIDRVLCDDAQDGTKIALGVDAVQLGRADEAVDRGGPLAPSIRAAKKIVLPAYRDRAQRALDGVVVDLDLPVVDIPG